MTESFRECTVVDSQVIVELTSPTTQAFRLSIFFHEILLYSVQTALTEYYRVGGFTQDLS